MSRYIEIIFDNSGSMCDRIQGKYKYDLAKNLFMENIYPIIGIKGDKVVLRTFRNSCTDKSRVEILKDKWEIEQKIMNIDDFNNLNPLYLTLKDSLNTCNKSKKKDKFIFILTDGDDNCSSTLEKTLTPEELKIKDEINLDILLVQFAVDSDNSQNNLTAFSQVIGATNVIINSKQANDNFVVKNKMDKVLINSGLNRKYSSLPHCFDVIKGEDIEWWTLEFLNTYDFYLTEILYKEGLLSWKPDKNTLVTPTMEGELEFLYSLRFMNNLSEAMVKQMLSKLQKPYKYSFDCIYWDFKERTWKYHREVPNVNIVPNPGSLEADNSGIENIHHIDIPESKEKFEEGQTYEVNHGNTIDLSFVLSEDINSRDIRKGVKVLKNGDFIIFKE